MPLLGLLYVVAVAGLALIAKQLGDRHARAGRRRRTGRTRRRPTRSTPRKYAAETVPAVTAPCPPETIASPAAIEPSIAARAQPPQTEPMIDIPVWLFDQLVEAFSRLEVLERRETMRLVQRKQRKANPTTRL
jgi:hypothetical protein